MEYLLKVDRLTKVYKKKNEEVHAVKDASFSIPKGRIIGLLGKNGSGKTTIIKSCCDIISYSGNISYGEKETCSKIFSAVLEGSRNIYMKLTVIENINFFAGLIGKTPKQIEEKANELIDSLYLMDKKNIVVENLSRGMQQKVAIICALIVDAPIVFLDEPTLGLDVESVSQIIDFFKSKKFLKDKSIFVTSHNLKFIQEVSDDIILIKNGRIITQCEISEIHKYSENSNIVEIAIKTDESIEKFLTELKTSNISVKKYSSQRNIHSFIVESLEKLNVMFYLDIMKSNFDELELVKFEKKQFDLEQFYYATQEGSK